jgi:hypothetical protein
MVNTREPLDPRISLWHFLAYYLRFQREKFGLSLTQWGKLIGAARSTVSNIEAGRLKIHDDQAKALDKEYDTGGLFQLLLFHARANHNPDWFRQFTQYEVQARIIRIYQGQIIPTPLQTADYARALLAARNAADLDVAVDRRLARQEAILSRPDPPLVWVLLDESVLKNEVGEPAITKAQLLHLLQSCELPHIAVRIIPNSGGAHIGFDGPFRVISMEKRDVAYAGAQRGGRLIEGTREVRELAVDYDRMGMKALSEDASRTLIERLAEVQR